MVKDDAGRQKARKEESDVERARQSGERQGREYEGGPTGRPDERNSTEQQYGQKDRCDPERR